jgi:hypothetical protein
MPNYVHNLPTSSAQPLVKLGIAVVHNFSPFVVVCTISRLCTTKALFITRSIHSYFSLFVSVKSVLVRSIHSAYKGSQKLKTLNYLILTSGELL